MATFGGGALGGITGGQLTSRLMVVISGNVSGLEASLAGASSSLASFNKNATSLGNSLIRGVTLPLLAVGGAALKMAMDYQAAMARVAGLTNATASQVQGAYTSILEMSKRVGVAPTELANSLYFAASAGLNFNTAMQVVELSAKGAAIGMGDAADISRTLIYALNAFKGTGLTAAQAMDTLTAAIKAGTAEPADFAIALGRVLPIAAQAGISFQAVVASIAQLTNIGIPARVAVTSLRALFQELIAPTQRAGKSLTEFGGDMTALRNAVAAGPLVAFRYLEKTFNGNIDAIHAFIPQIRGLTAFLGLTGDRAADTARIFDQVIHSTGDLNRAFAVISQTVQFKFNLALQSLRVAGIELGTRLFPIFEGLIGAFSDLGDTFSHAPGWAQEVTAAFLVMAAAAGPLIKIWGVLNNNGEGLFTTFKGSALGLTLMAAAAGLAVGAFQSLSHGTISLTNILTLAITSFVAATIAIKALAAVAATGALGTNRLSVGLLSLGSKAGLIGAGIAILGTVIAYTIGQMHAMEREGNNLRQSLDKLNLSVVLTKDFFDSLKSNQLTSTFQAIAQAAGVMGQQLGKSFSALRQKTGLELTQSLIELQSALIGVGRNAEASKLTPYITALGNGVAAGRDFSRSLGAAGLSAKDFNNIVNEFSHEVAGPYGDQISKLASLSDTLYNAQKDLQAQTQANIIVFAAQQAKVQDLADTYHVTADEVTAAASQMGVDVLGLNSTTELAFAQQAGWVDQATGKIIGDLHAQQAAEEKLVEQRIQSTAQSIKLFAALPKALKQSTDELIKQAQKQAAFYTQEAANIQKLLAKGLDPQVLQQLVDQGPEFVAKFVNASKGQLGKLETAYNDILGAVDLAILNEGKHEAIKGSAMVTQFAEGIRKLKRLPESEMVSIMGAMISAAQSGKLDQAGVDDVMRFAQGIAKNKHIPARLAGEIINSYIATLSNKKGLLQAGTQSINEYVAGILKRAGIPAKTAQKIASDVKDALAHAGAISQDQGQQVAQHFGTGLNIAGPNATEQAAHIAQGVSSNLKKPNGFALGQGVGSAYARGLASEAGAAYQAGYQVGQAGKKGLNDGSKGSPRYFGYYLGHYIVQDYVKGMKEEIAHMKSIRIRGLEVDPVSRIPISSLGVSAGDTHNHTHITIPITGPVYGVDDLEDRMMRTVDRAVRKAVVH